MSCRNERTCSVFVFIIGLLIKPQTAMLIEKNKNRNKNKQKNQAQKKKTLRKWMFNVDSFKVFTWLLCHLALVFKRDFIHVKAQAIWLPLKQVICHRNQNAVVEIRPIFFLFIFFFWGWIHGSAEQPWKE